MLSKVVGTIGVRCDIVGNESDGYSLQIATYGLDAPPAERVWAYPEGRLFATRLQAERYGKTLILAMNVDDSGLPSFAGATSRVFQND